ncbi:SAM-dependent methyltransferase [Schlesneria paludicola]|uniref:SAM-dependent methyltransferase n=1 Tax=Schlesneria paludicola TaxID=360056 RepID=UPI00029A0CAF|nr:cyclopropane-fatty-acyl-phospholipid synthase family protein [Schlesneria paludicola]
MTESLEISPKPVDPVHGLDKIARRALLSGLKRLRNGQISISGAGEEVKLGEAADLQASIVVRNPRFFRDVLMGGTLSVAESYLGGDWDCADLTTLFRIFIRNMETTTRMSEGFNLLTGVTRRIYHWWHANSPQGSRRNIGAHYDLGNDFFRLWLDETMTYSSGIFSTPKASMQDASIEKIDRVCRKLELGPDDNLLEIGTGWGAFAIHAARHYGCHVTTTTISPEQFQFARQRIDEAGLSDRINLISEDYRNLTGQYQKLVSIEMIEAVGYRYLDTFFRKCGELLRPDGSMVLQAIVLPERGYHQYLRNVDFIQRYIFPGGCLPSLGTMLESAGRTTNLRFVHGEDFGPHYAQTLRCWRQKFHQCEYEIRKMGYSRQFIRMWTYYLCYCEAVFEERYGGVLQVQFDKPQCRRDPIRLSAQAAEWASVDWQPPSRKRAPSGRLQQVDP